MENWNAMKFSSHVTVSIRLMVCLLASSLHQANAATQPDAGYLETSIAELRGLVGKSLLDTVLQISNDQTLILERVTAQGATFFLSGNNKKVVGEPFDALRKRNYIGLSLTTCSGAKTLDSKIATVSAWENYAEDAPQIGVHLQRLLELMNTPPSVATPSSMRAPRVQTLHGIVYEYVKGDSTEDLSITNDLDEAFATPPLRANWQITNSSYCPKP